ncbi:MAG: two-component sensor histidine kinase [Bacteroidaceae bacterium]|nr:two-component sensor histidine kinase [Bacteroidaceae bacterium]
MNRFFSRFFVPVLLLLLLLSVSFLYYHHEKERQLAVMHQQGVMRNMNESVYDFMRMQGTDLYTDSCGMFIQRYVARYEKQGLRVTVIDAGNGRVLFDSSLPDGAELLDHSLRPEVVQALSCGYGYDVRRMSSVHNEEYFYVATYNPEFGFVVRTSMPYGLVLKADSASGLVLLVIIGTVIAVVLYLLYRIMKFAGSKELATENLLLHLRIAQEGVAIFDSRRRLVLANPLFSEYADFISTVHLSKVENILRQPELRNIKRFIDNEGYVNNSERKKFISDKVEVSGRVFALRAVLFGSNGFEVVINDITVAEEQSRLKQQLTQNIAHEFKTPVCSIQGYLETIIQNYPDKLSGEQLQHFLQRCYSQSSRLNNLVQDMSQLSAMTTPVQRMRKEIVDVSQIVRNILQEVNNRILEQRMTVENRLPETLVLNGDASMVYSIFRNLFDNAIAYAGDGTAITVSCFRSDADSYYFSFLDNGNGVPEEHISRIFERFYRVDKGRSRKLGGTGLGLAIVKNAVMLHGGAISARNVPSGGLEFVFNLCR